MPRRAQDRLVVERNCAHRVAVGHPLETGLEDYFDSPEPSPPQEQLDSDHPDIDDSLEEDFDEPDGEAYDDEDAPGAEEDGSDDATAVAARHAHAPAPRLTPGQRSRTSRAPGGLLSSIRSPAGAHGPSSPPSRSGTWHSWRS